MYVWQGLKENVVFKANLLCNESMQRCNPWCMHALVQTHAHSSIGHGFLALELNRSSDVTLLSLLPTLLDRSGSFCCTCTSRLNNY